MKPAKETRNAPLDPNKRTTIRHIISGIGGTLLLLFGYQQYLKKSMQDAYNNDKLMQDAYNKGVEEGTSMNISKTIDSLMTQYNLPDTIVLEGQTFDVRTIFFDSYRALEQYRIQQIQEDNPYNNSQTETKKETIRSNMMSPDFFNFLDINRPFVEQRMKKMHINSIEDVLTFAQQTTNRYEKNNQQYFPKPATITLALFDMDGNSVGDCDDVSYTIFLMISIVLENLLQKETGPMRDAIQKIAEERKLVSVHIPSQDVGHAFLEKWYDKGGEKSFLYVDPFLPDETGNIVHDMKTPPPVLRNFYNYNLKGATTVENYLRYRGVLSSKVTRKGFIALFAKPISNILKATFAEQPQQESDI